MVAGWPLMQGCSEAGHRAGIRHMREILLVFSIRTRKVPIRRMASDACGTGGLSDKICLNSNLSKSLMFFSWPRLVWFLGRNAEKEIAACQSNRECSPH